MPTSSSLNSSIASMSTDSPKAPFSSLTAIISHITDLLTETLVITDEEGAIKAVLAPGKNSFSERCELNKTLDAVLGCDLETARTVIEQAAQEGQAQADVNAQFSASLHAKRYEAEKGRFCVCIRETSAAQSNHSAPLIEQVLFASSEQAIAVLDANFTLQAVNQGFCSLLAIDETRAIGRPPFFLDSVSDAIAAERIWSALANGQGWKGEFFVPGKDGQEMPVWLSVETVKLADNTVNHLLSFSDISQQQKDKAKQNRGAFIDQLTGLSNREAFFGQLNTLLKRNKNTRRSYALMILDIDQFQAVNEGIGYELSNEVLIEISRCLKDVATDNDTVARIGGDEFALILDDVGEKTTVASRAKSLLQHFATPLHIGKYRVEVTVGIGACLFPNEDVNNTADLIKKTDTALLSAKRSGKNSFRIFSAAQALQRNEFFQLEMGLRQAQAMKQLSLTFQPQYDIRNNHITGAEVFTRWKHPILGLIPPSRFIPVAEKSGFIDNLGDWILEEAISQLGKWQQMGMPLFTLSINLSRQQLINPDIPSRVAQLVKQHHLRPEVIEFEISENHVASLNKAAIANVHALTQLGCQLALDDFGVKGASLANLKRFKFNRIKLDQAFIARIPHDREETAMVQAVLVFAKSLNITAIAEGVETDEQANFLIRYGCNHQQGYLYSQALAAEDYESMITARQSS